ncbi:MAG: CHAT domain-containing tetratricopeptide repeat protein [Terracidiphilus sp.]
MAATACALLEIPASSARAQTTPQANSQNAPLKDQIALHEQQLAEAAKAKQYRSEVTELNTLGSLYRQAGNMQKALDDCNQALQLENRRNSQMGQAITQGIIGRIYSDMGDEPKALDLFTQTLETWRQLGSHAGEALALTNMGRSYSNLAQEEKALEVLNQALPIWRQAANRNGEAEVLDMMGKVYSDMSLGQKSLDALNQALAIWRETGNRAGEALSLNNMGRTYSDLGQKAKTLESYNQALSIWKEIGNLQGQASSLDDLGRVYSDLGQKQTALDYFNQGLPVWRESGNRNGEALDLNDIGRAHADLGQPQQSLDFYNQALVIWREVGNRRGEAMTMSNLGRAYLDLGQPDKSLEIELQSLPVWHEAKESRGEAMAFGLIGMAYAKLGQPQTAFPYSLAALTMAKAAGDPDMRGAIDTGMMVGIQKQNRPEVAIFFGLDGVNSYQQIRKNISGLEKDLQAGFAQSRASTYRILAELLVQTGRLGEAEQVLDLLKEQELKDVVRGASENVEAKVEPLKLSDAQQKAQSELDSQQQKTLALEDMSLQYAALKAKAAPTAADEAQLKKLTANLQQGIGEIEDYFANTVCGELERKPANNQSEGSAGEDFRQSYLQNTLAKLGPHVLGIRILLGEVRVYAIVVTATTRKKFELKATPAELRSKVFEVLETMAARNADPKSGLAQLYAMVVAPVEGELKKLEAQPGTQGDVPTLLWSLDDALRYLPMAALYDGRQYMLERFKNVLFTPESYGHMTDTPLAKGSAPSVLAMGLSKSYGGLPPLPGVLPELDSVVHDPAVPESHGPMEGKLLPDEQFTLAALKAELGEGKGFPVVHIASHFVVETGSGDEPFLMLGGETSGDAKGYEWSLSEMEHSAVAFHGTRLLTLSACSTAKDYKTRDGTEMDSLGMIAQQKDAEAVLATLWDVNDASTSRLMSDFYSRWLKDPASGKAEALRQAQLALLRGPAASPKGRSQRGFETVGGPSTMAPQAGYSHPFYWAPFVLIGNYQ